MSAEAENRSAREIVEAVRASFPQDAKLVDDTMERDMYDHDAYFSWVERFSQITTDAIKQGDFGKARAHLNLISSSLANGDESAVRCIDVAYVEPLMWDIRDDARKLTGWNLIPGNLRVLYLAMWGQQPFMGRAKNG